MAKDKHIRFDWAMKRLLRNKANFGILEGFLSELLKQDIAIQEILESEGNAEEQNSKINRVDILVKGSKGQLMLIEVQNEKEDDYFHRMLFGQAKAISERLDAGQKYGKLMRVYSINIVYFQLGQGKDYVYISDGNFYGMHYKDDILQLSKKQRDLYGVDEVRDIFTKYYILKVNNFDGIARDSLDQWVYFLKNSEIKDEFTAKGLEEAKEKMRVDDLSPAEKEDYEAFIKNERIRESEITTAFTDGQYDAEKKLMPKINEALKIAEQAEQKAEQERKEKEQAQSRIGHIVVKQHKKGKTDEQIADDLGIPVEEVKAIIERYSKND